MSAVMNSDNQTLLGSDTSQRVETLVETRLARISDRLTRVEVHVSDVDGPRSGGDDKKCVIELRPNGMRPITVSDQASTVERAVTAATYRAPKAFVRQLRKAQRAMVTSFDRAISIQEGVYGSGMPAFQPKRT